MPSRQETQPPSGEDHLVPAPDADHVQFPDALNQVAEDPTIQWPQKMLRADLQLELVKTSKSRYVHSP